jgi:glycosyltransferase involved in cell wall biosynthesis
LRMVLFLIRLRYLCWQSSVDNVLLYGAPTPWHWVLRWMFPICNFVTYVHDPSPHSGETLKRRLFSWLDVRLNLKQSKTLITSFENAVPVLERRLGRRPPQIRIAKLPMLSDFSSEDNAVEQDALFFGRLEAYKGLDFLEHVLVSFERKRIHLQLSIVGRGPLEEKVRDIVRNHTQVHHETAYLSKGELADRIVRSRMVVLPYSDATGTHVIQIANSLGRPVVCTDVGCFPEYVNEGVNGFICPVGNVERFVHAIDTILRGSVEEWRDRCIAYANENASIEKFAIRINSIVHGDLP